jgi:hypothetical protein
VREELNQQQMPGERRISKTIARRLRF